MEPKTKLNARKGRISERQQQIMLEFFDSHPELLRNKFSPLFTAAKKNQLWDELTGLLNSNALGPEKTTDKWIKTWTDWKCLTKAKAARVSRQHQATGGGPRKEILSPEEEKLMSFISMKSATGMNVEEGGFSFLRNDTVETAVEIETITLPTASTDLTSLDLPSCAGTSKENIVILMESPHIPEVLISSNSPMSTLSETRAPSPIAIEDTTTPCSSDRKKFKRQGKITRAAFDSATAAFKESEERNVAAREGIRAACQSIADAAEKQAQATENVAAALNNIAGALLAIAVKLNK